MDDKILIEDDIVDLTDLLEEGNPPSGKSKDNSARRKVNEPDSFDLGKEISMEYEVSVEEIEQGAGDLRTEPAPGKVSISEIQVDNFEAKPGKEPLLDIEKEIDLAIQDKFDDVSLTSKEEEMLLKDEPLEEPMPGHEEKEPKPDAGIQLETEIPPTAEAVDTDLESLLEDTPVSTKTEDKKMESLLEDKPVANTIEETELESLLEDKHVPGQAAMAADAIVAETDESVLEKGTPEPVPAAPDAKTSPLALPVEVVTGTLIEELKKEMPSLLESIMRPLVKELLQEVIVATRDALPSLVERVIREEIEKLKKI